MFSFIGISSLRKLSSSLTPYLSRSSLSLRSLSSYSRYFIYYCKPPMYYSSRIFWVGLFFKLLIVCSKFFFGTVPDFVKSCPYTFLGGPDLNNKLPWIAVVDLYRFEPSNILLAVLGTFRLDWYIDWVVFLIQVIFLKFIINLILTHGPMRLFAINH